MYKAPAWLQRAQNEPPSLPLPSGIQSGQGLREMGLASSCQLIKGQAPECVSQNSQAALPEHPRACSWSPSYSIPFPLSYRPLSVSALWPVPPRSEGIQYKRSHLDYGEANSRLCLERQRASSVYVQKWPITFQSKKLWGKKNDERIP